MYTDGLFRSNEIVTDTQDLLHGLRANTWVNIEYAPLTVRPSNPLHNNTSESVKGVLHCCWANKHNATPIHVSPPSLSSVVHLIKSIFTKEQRGLWRTLELCRCFYFTLINFRVINLFKWQAIIASVSLCLSNGPVAYENLSFRFLVHVVSNKRTRPTYERKHEQRNRKSNLILG